MPIIGNPLNSVAFLTDSFNGTGAQTVFTMSVAPATSSSIYCVYLTTYFGKALPPFYIGSTSITRVINGYHGSVRSATYRPIWERELIDNPELFSTKILSKHVTREEALEHELLLQKDLDVVSSNLFINKAWASGCFGNMGKEALEKMKATKKANVKQTVAKMMVTKNNPEWKATVGKAASLKLSKTKRDPLRADKEAERSRKYMATVNNPEWKATTGKEHSRKISIAVRKIQDNDEWRSTKGVERRSKMIATINKPEWKATIGAKANKQRSITVSQTKSNPEWKLKNSTACELCNVPYANNVFARHQVKCKERNAIACHI